MERITLKNELLTVTIETLGAQLISVVDAGGVERIWQADPKIWGRHAPLLFPIGGRLKGETYTVYGEQYHIPMHGFARDREFQVLECSDTKVVFRQEDDEQTRQVFPFAFALEVTYTLEEDRLRKSHRVINRDSRDMYYELGGHDGFATTLLPGETMDDYFLQFEDMDSLHPYVMDENCWMNPKGDTFPLLSGGRLALPPDVFGMDTVVLDEFPRRRVSLISAKGSRRVTMEFDDFEYLGIWTKPQAEPTHYICIEPWTTLPDGNFYGRALEEKPGIRCLAPGGEETLVYTTIFHT